MKNVLKSVEKIQAELELIKQAVLEGADSGQADIDLDNLDSLKLDELKKIATDSGIEMGKKPTKKSLIEAILEFYSDEDEDSEEDEDEDDSEEDEDNEDEDEQDEDDEEGEGYSEEDLDELDDEELTEVAEEFELDVAEFQKKKGKKKVLDRDALIEAILEAQESEDEDEQDDDEDESDEDSIEFLDDEELDELETDELKAHHSELVAYVEEELEEELPKGAKLKGKAKDKDIKKAILALYDFIEDAEGEEE